MVLALFLGHHLRSSGGGTALRWRVAEYWRSSNVVLLRWIAGIETVVEGAENIPAGPVIFASKHQSNWDIFAILPYCDDKPAFIAKRELIDIPFFGWAAQSIDTISIDRKLGGAGDPEDAARMRARR